MCLAGHAKMISHLNSDPRLSAFICGYYFPFVALLGLVGSAAMIFWLLVFGVNTERWKEQASGGAMSVGT